MAMSFTDQILMRLGIHHGDIDPEMAKAGKKVKSGLDRMAGGFVNFGKAGRKIKETMREITAEAPLLGTAMNLAMNPIVGTMIGAATAFSHFKGKIEETNKELDKMGEQNAKSLWRIRDATRDATREVNALNREHDKAILKDKEQSEVITERTNQRIKEIGYAKTLQDLRTDQKFSEEVGKIREMAGGKPENKAWQDRMEKEAEKTREFRKKQAAAAAATHEYAAREQERKDLEAAQVLSGQRMEGAKGKYIDRKAIEKVQGHDRVIRAHKEAMEQERDRLIKLKADADEAQAKLDSGAYANSPSEGGLRKKVSDYQKSKQVYEGHQTAIDKAEDEKLRLADEREKAKEEYQGALKEHERLQGKLDNAKEAEKESNRKRAIAYYDLQPGYMDARQRYNDEAARRYPDNMRPAPNGTGFNDNLLKQMADILSRNVMRVHVTNTE